MAGPSPIPPEGSSAPEAEPPGRDPAAARASAAVFRPPPDFSGLHETFEPAADEGRDLSAAALAARLPPVSFGDAAFLMPSKRMAFAHALDMIRARQRASGRPKRSRLLICAGAGPAAVPDGLDADVEILRLDDPEAVEAQITPRTAGFLIEPLRPEAGLEPVAGELLASLRQAADDYGLALVFDESFCGLGRSGMMWAYEWTGVTPDILICGEGLAGPRPLAATIATQKYARALPEPALDAEALAAAHAKLDALLAPGFLESVQNRSWRLEDQLALLAHKRRDLFRGRCGLGLMQGLVCVDDALKVSEELARSGLAARPMENTLGLIAPLRVEDEDIDSAAAIIAAAFAPDADPGRPDAISERRIG